MKKTNAAGYQDPELIDRIDVPAEGDEDLHAWRRDRNGGHGNHDGYEQNGEDAAYARSLLGFGHCGFLVGASARHRVVPWVSAQGEEHLKPFLVNRTDGQGSDDPGLARHLTPTRPLQPPPRRR